MGAPDPARSEPPSDDELAGSTSWEAVREKTETRWSFQPIVPYKDSRSSEPTRVQSTVGFDFASREDDGSRETPADRRFQPCLARRLPSPITGLRPSAESVADFPSRSSMTHMKQFTSIGC